MKKSVFIACVGLLLMQDLHTNAQPSSPSKDNSVVLATWNIGHFSKGSKRNSTITADIYEGKLSAFRDIIYKNLSPDILCINEFSTGFGQDEAEEEQSSVSVLFDGFKIKEVFEQIDYCCNAIFSNFKIRHVKKKNFKCSQSYINEIPTADNYYYVSGVIKIRNEKIRIVCTHLIPKVDNAELRSKQIGELIDLHNRYDKVIMCGDWNTSIFTAFKNAGYSLANDKEIVTFPSKSSFLDNIITKGLKISDVRAIETDLSDHYPLVCKISIE